MNTKIKRMLANLEADTGAHTAAIHAVKAKIQSEFDRLYSKDASLAKQIAKLEASKEYGSAKRNALIEAHMQRSGHFPGVFRISRNGNVFPEDTRPECPNEACNSEKMSNTGDLEYTCNACGAVRSKSKISIGGAK